MRFGRAVALAAGLALGAAAPVRAAETQEVPLTIEQHRFTQPEVRVKAGTPAVLVVTNRDASAEEFESKALRIEKVIPAGKTLRIRIPALAPGQYEFVGEFHEATARGRIVAE